MDSFRALNIAALNIIEQSRVMYLYWAQFSSDGSLENVKQKVRFFFRKRGNLLIFFLQIVKLQVPDSRRWGGRAGEGQGRAGHVPTNNYRLAAWKSIRCQHPNPPQLIFQILWHNSTSHFMLLWTHLGTRNVCRCTN